MDTSNALLCIPILYNSTGVGYGQYDGSDCGRYLDAKTTKAVKSQNRTAQSRNFPPDDHTIGS